MLESKRKALDKYNSKCKSFLLKFNTEKEDDQKVIEQLEKQASKSDYIRKLVLADIEQKGQ